MKDWWLQKAPVSFVWDLWYRCNYRCSYCFWEMADLWDKPALSNLVLPPEKWLSIWARVYSHCGSARIDLVGGEPLFYPGAEDLIAGLAEKHTLQITTNLSLPTDRLKALLRRVSGERVHFNASYHPEFADLREFTDKVLLLKEAGFEPGVLFVTWPPFLERLQTLVEMFKTEGISFTPMIFQGAWRGRNFPADYTEREKRLIAFAMNDAPPAKEAKIKYRLERNATLGKLCHAGEVYANIKGSGEVFRCGQDAFGLRPLGNILDEEFRLLAGPKPCPYEHCSCLEFQFLDEIYGRRLSRDGPGSVPG